MCLAEQPRQVMKLGGCVFSRAAKAGDEARRLCAVEQKQPRQLKLGGCVCSRNKYRAQEAELHCISGAEEVTSAELRGGNSSIKCGFLCTGNRVHYTL